MSKDSIVASIENCWKRLRIAQKQSKKVQFKLISDNHNGEYMTKLFDTSLFVNTITLKHILTITFYLHRLKEISIKNQRLIVISWLKWLDNPVFSEVSKKNNRPLLNWIRLCQSVYFYPFIKFINKFIKICISLNLF